MIAIAYSILINQFLLPQAQCPFEWRKWGSVELIYLNQECLTIVCIVYYYVLSRRNWVRGLTLFIWMFESTTYYKNMTYHNYCRIVIIAETPNVNVPKGHALIWLYFIKWLNLFRCQFSHFSLFMQHGDGGQQRNHYPLIYSKFLAIFF